VHTGKPLVEARLVQLATIKANCHVASTTLAPPNSQNATPPFTVFIICPSASLARVRQQLAANAEVPFRVPIRSASLLLGNIGNNVGHLSAEVPYIVPADGTGRRQSLLQ
jgi:hypothetical protein